jgi:hypothetical protein
VRWVITSFMQFIAVFDTLKNGNPSSFEGRDEMENIVAIIRGILGHLHTMSSQSLQDEEEIDIQMSPHIQSSHDGRQTDVTLLELMFNTGMGIKIDKTKLWSLIGEDFWNVMTQTYAIMGSGMNPRSRRLLMELLGFGMSMATEGAPEKREEVISSLVQSLHSIEEGSSQSDEMLVAPEDSLLVELIAAEILQHPMESTISKLVSHLNQGRFSVLVIFEAILRVPTSSLGANVIDSVVALLHHERLAVRKGAIRVLSLTSMPLSPTSFNSDRTRVLVSLI